ncbi:hypothetical protein MRX96_044098 [Rhipicephalus microplus]
MVDPSLVTFAGDTWLAQFSYCAFYPAIWRSLRGTCQWAIAEAQRTVETLHASCEPARCCDPALLISRLMTRMLKLNSSHLRNTLCMVVCSAPSPSLLSIAQRSGGVVPSVGAVCDLSFT